MGLTKNKKTVARSFRFIKSDGLWAVNGYSHPSLKNICEKLSNGLNEIVIGFSNDPVLFEKEKLELIQFSKYSVKVEGIERSIDLGTLVRDTFKEYPTTLFLF